jgi:hypothetical protein
MVVEGAILSEVVVEGTTPPESAFSQVPCRCCMLRPLDIPTYYGSDMRVKYI